MKLDIIVVTYNRLEKLKNALDSYDRQTAYFRNLIVVNNCSTDGTTKFLEEWEQRPTTYNKIVINSPENLGGSGGFYLGQKKSMELTPDWVYVADDDAYADFCLVELFYSFVKSHDTDKISAICSSVCAPSGEVYTFHRDRWNLIDGKRFHRVSVPLLEYENDFFFCDLFSYVGTFLKASALREGGLVNPNYFIFMDDSEHSFRMKKYGDIVCVPKLKVVHDTTVPINSNHVLSWREYYLVRNEIHMLKKHMPFCAVLWMLLSFVRKRGRDISRDKAYLSLYRHAFIDAMFGRLGIHRIYKPGWNADNA